MKGNSEFLPPKLVNMRNEKPASTQSAGLACRLPGAGSLFNFGSFFKEKNGKLVILGAKANI